MAKVKAAKAARGAGTWAFSKTVGSRFFRRRLGRRLRRRRAPSRGHSEGWLYTDLGQDLLPRVGHERQALQVLLIVRGRCVRVAVWVGATIVLVGQPAASRGYRLRAEPGPRLVSRSPALRWRLGSPTECHSARSVWACFWVLLPWQAPRARPGAFGTDLVDPKARVGGLPGGRSAKGKTPRILPRPDSSRIA